MEIGVKVYKEDFRTLQRVHILSAYFTFVALDDHLKPVEVPAVLPQSVEEKRRYEDAEKRRQLRFQNR